MSSSNDIYSSNNNSDHFLLGVGLTAGFLIFIAVMTTVAYIIGRRRGLPGVLHDPEGHGAAAADVKAEVGLDEATLKAFPKLLYTKTDPNKLFATINCGISDKSCYSTALSCSVCLADYGESEVLRVLPDCGHVFHLKCVDSWLRLHPTCPVCRSLPTSASTSPDSSADRTRT